MRASSILGYGHFFMCRLLSKLILFGVALSYILLLPLIVSGENHTKPDESAPQTEDLSNTNWDEEPANNGADLSNTNWDEEPVNNGADLSNTNWDEEPVNNGADLSNTNWDEEAAETTGGSPEPENRPDNYLHFDETDYQSNATPQIQQIEDPVSVHIKGIFFSLFYFAGLLFCIQLGSRSRIYRNILPEIIIVLYAFWPVFLLVYLYLRIYGKKGFYHAT